MSACSIILVISALSPTFILLRAFTEEFEHCGIELRGLLDLWHVTTLIEDNEFRTGNVLIKMFAFGHRDETILTSPDKQRRSLNCFDSVVEKVFAANDRFGDAVDGVTITCGKTSGDRLIDCSVSQKQLVI